MGNTVNKAASGFGDVVGKVFSAPFKTVFGASCEDVCAGAWDVLCFIEHLCVSNLVKLLLILGLCYIGFLFFYLSFQLGICQCIGRSLCSMCWAACDGYWHSLKYICSFCWYKLKNTKRVYRGRRKRRTQRLQVSDIESSESESSNQSTICRKRKSVREGRKAQLSISSRHSSYRQRHHRHHHHRHHSSRGISLRVNGGSDRLKINSRKLNKLNVKNHKRNVGSSKRRRLE